MAQTQISRQYPGKSASEIYAKVDEVMARIAEKMNLDYHKDPERYSGSVSKMGVSGTYQARDGAVTVDLKFPIIVPGSMRQKVQSDIERKLDGLFA